MLQEKTDILAKISRMEVIITDLLTAFNPFKNKLILVLSIKKSQKRQ